MFQFPLLGSTLPGLAKGLPGERTLSGDSLTALLQGTEGELPLFGGELQALISQLSPAMLQRFDELLAGGKSLPQAANTLLDEFAGDGLDGEFAGLLRRLVGTPGEQPPVVTAKVADKALATMPAPVMGATAGEPVGAALASTLLQTAGPPVAGSTMTQAPGSLPQQLAHSLLDMAVPQQVGSRAWPQAIAERVSWMVQGEQQFARLKLNPPNLGPLEVRVSVSQEQTNVAFLAQHASVREALEAAMPRLREMFDQSSLQLVRADVSDPGAQQGQGSAGPGGGFAGGDGGERDGVAGAEFADENADDRQLVVGLLDVFA